MGLASRNRHASIISGTLLGGAVGDALGAPLDGLSLAQIRARYGPQGLRDYAPAYGRAGAITWYTQMALFTAEGAIRAKIRAMERGIGGAEVALVHYAYLRWLRTQDEPPPSDARGDPQPDAWLFTLPALYSRRGASETVLAALKTGSMGSPDQPVNGSKGCAAAARSAPLGLTDHRDIFRWGCDVGALTHGHPTGWVAAGIVAWVVSRLAQAEEPQSAVRQAVELPYAAKEGGECRQALEAAARAAEWEAATPETVEKLGRGWTADEALSMAAYCMLRAESFEQGILLAANHGGASSAVGTIAGSLLGARFGREAIPQRWLERLELHTEIERLAGEMFDHFGQTSTTASP